MALPTASLSLEPLTRYLSTETISILSKITFTTGALTLTSIVYKTLRSIYSRFRPSRISRYQHAPCFDITPSDLRAWALVTGANDGLGFAFSNALAARGFNIVLHGRNEAKLKKSAASIESRHKVSTRLLILDATKYPNSPEEYALFDKTVLAAVSDINLTVLVNNVGGVTTVDPEYNKFDRTLPQHMDNLINVNARFPTHITRVVIPLLERNQPGLILNISSGTALAPTPWAVIYSAGKAYNSQFSCGLKTEFLAENKDVESLALEVLFTVTSGTARDERDVSVLVPSADTIAESSLGLVGCGYMSVTPYLPHALQAAVMLFVAGYSQSWLEKQMIAMFQDSHKYFERRVKEAKGQDKKAL